MQTFDSAEKQNTDHVVSISELRWHSLFLNDFLSQSPGQRSFTIAP